MDTEEIIYIPIWTIKDRSNGRTAARLCFIYIPIWTIKDVQ